MKMASLPLLIGLIALTGCAHYVMVLNNNEEIVTASKPKLQDGIYQFKDAKGEEHFVAEVRVRSIEPASMSDRDSKAHQVKVEQPKKKHKWYLLWLA